MATGRPRTPTGRKKKEPNSSPRHVPKNKARLKQEARPKFEERFGAPWRDEWAAALRGMFETYAERERTAEALLVALNNAIADAAAFRAALGFDDIADVLGDPEVGEVTQGLAAALDTFYSDATATALLRPAPARYVMRAFIVRVLASPGEYAFAPPLDDLATLLAVAANGEALGDRELAILSVLCGQAPEAKLLQVEDVSIGALMNEERKCITSLRRRLGAQPSDDDRGDVD